MRSPLHAVSASTISRRTPRAASLLPTAMGPGPARAAPPAALALLALLALGSGCDPTDGASGSATPTEGTDASASPSQGEPSAPIVTRPRSEPLRVTLAAPAPEGELPSGIEIRFSRAIEGPEQEVAETAAFEISPPVEGRLRRTGPRTLTFTPARPFEHDTEFTARLLSFEREGTLVTPSQGEAWQLTFATPPFQLLGITPVELDLGNHRVQLDIVFSGQPASLEAVRRAAVFSVDGVRIPSRITGSGARHRVRAVLGGGELRAGSTLLLTLRAGVPSSSESSMTRSASEARLDLFGGQPLEVSYVNLAEGNSGFYLDVYCKDRREDGTVHWSDPGCRVTDEEAEQSIRFDPPVAFSVAPTRNGFRILGDFRRGPVSLTLDAGMTTIGGSILQRSMNQTFTVGPRSPQISFGSEGRYLPRPAWNALTVRHLNVEELKLTARHVPAHNLVFWMSQPRGDAVDERVANVVAQRTVPVASPDDALAATRVDVGELVPWNTKGLIEIRAEGSRASANARVLLTDMSLIAKRMAETDERPGAVRVWALGMQSTEPIDGVEVSAVKKSGSKVAGCTTSGADGCLLEIPPTRLPTEAPFALIAQRGEDLTYLKYADLELDTESADVSGEPYRATQPYRAALYGDRELYRPGETAHVVTILRKEDHAAPAPGMPISFTVTDPRGRELWKHTRDTNTAGAAELRLPLSDDAETGGYRVLAEVAGKRVGEHTFQVEAFVPERMKAAAAAGGAGLVGESVPVTVSARYLFGGSAEGAEVEVTCLLRPSPYAPPGHAALSFGRSDRGGEATLQPISLGQHRVTLDEAGEATAACDTSSGSGWNSPAQLVAQVAVFEAGSGRSTRAEATSRVHPERHYLGMKADAREVSPGRPLQIEGSVLDWDGKLLSDVEGPVQLGFFQLQVDYNYVYNPSLGTHRWEQTLHPTRVGGAEVEVEDGRFSTSVEPEVGQGGFLVRAELGSATSELTLESDGPSYSWYGRSSDQTPRPERPTQLALRVDGPARVGEPLAIALDAPFPGRALVTLETDEVLDSRWIEVGEAGVLRWEQPIEQFHPNVYVSALLIKDPHHESEEAFLPDRAFGITSVRVEPTEYTLPVKLRTPERLGSNETLEVTLDVGPVSEPTFVTVAAVDEGILSLTRYESPDPLAELFARRKLGVDTYETVGWTRLVPPAGPSGPTGGDTGASAAGRPQPVKPVALWSGVVEVPADGKVTIPLEVPTYRGELRVMAVAFGPRRVGRAEARVQVTDPIVLSTTLPRFLVAGDEIQIPVFLSNQAGKALDVTVRLDAENLPIPGVRALAGAPSPLELLGEREGRLRLEEGASGTLVFQARANKAVGAARLEVVASGGGHESFETLEVPFTPAGATVRKNHRITLSEGRTPLAPLLEGWVPSTDKSTFWVSQNPYGESFDHLAYLVRYPYGCLEQTTSTARPLLFASRLIGSVSPELLAEASVEERLMRGVDRVLTMQTASGGFAYWPGSHQPQGWGTAYATHFLLDARKEGYPVSAEAIESALRWAEGEVARYERGARSSDHYGNAEPYLHYVLALAGKGQKARIQKLIDALPSNPRGEIAEHAYMLKAALYRSGDRRYERELKQPDLGPTRNRRDNSWSFYSDQRRLGFTLSTFQDLFGSDPAGEPLAQRVADSLRGRPSGAYTTQELVWGITGLGKRVGDPPERFEPPGLLAKGEPLPPARLPGKSPERSWSVQGASTLEELTLELPKKEGGEVYLLVSTEGVRTGEHAPLGGEGLELTRTYRDLQGRQLDPFTKPPALGDLFFVELKLRNTTGAIVRNLALVDRLPAGWEIENPRLGRGMELDWMQPASLWELDAMSVEDDRMELFGALGPAESRTFVYAVRAITAGSFTVPPASVEAMYDPSVWARVPGGRSTVTGPWADFLL